MLSQCGLKLVAECPSQNAWFHCFAKSYRCLFFLLKKIYKIFKQKSESKGVAKSLLWYAIFERWTHARMRNLIKNAKFVDNAISMWPETCC